MKTKKAKVENPVITEFISNFKVSRLDYRIKSDPYCTVGVKVKLHDPELLLGEYGGYMWIPCESKGQKAHDEVRIMGASMLALGYIIPVALFELNIDERTVVRVRVQRWEYQGKIQHSILALGHITKDQWIVKDKWDDKYLRWTW